MTSDLHFCKRCFLGETDETALYKSVLEYINSLSEDIKCSESEYASRLAFCKNCGYLDRGVCGLCGCFAEVRAVKRNLNCPDIKQPKW